VEHAAPDAARGPCAGFRVVDFSTVVSGPLCSQILGDLGADVIKVETPVGDISRFMGPPFREGGLSGMFTQFNRNKRSVALDLKRDEAREIARRLARDADVVVQNFRPGVAERLGIGDADLRPGNPGLVYVAISGFGPDGPHAAQPAYDLVIQGLIGLMPAQGGAGRPALMKSLLADKCTALTAASAAVAALLARERSGGTGQRVDVPMLDAFAAYALPDVIVTEAFQPAEPGVAPRLDIYRTWETADGYVVGIVIQDDQFRGVCRALAREDLLEDARYASFAGRLQHADALFEVFETELRKWPTAEFVARARAEEAPFGPVNDVTGFFADPQVRHNRTWEDVEDPEGGTIRYLRHPARYSATPASLRRHPPRLGQHTEEVLREAGYGSGELRRWRESGLIR
jgi:crotonobetainyl-CoA:carnitine CoA-transferase CaiB-like acyl-CoA transferase